MKAKSINQLNAIIDRDPVRELYLSLRHREHPKYQQMGNSWRNRDVRMRGREGRTWNNPYTNFLYFGLHQNIYRHMGKFNKEGYDWGMHRRQGTYLIKNYLYELLEVKYELSFSIDKGIIFCVYVDDLPYSIRKGIFDDKDAFFLPATDKGNI